MSKTTIIQKNDLPSGWRVVGLGGVAIKIGDGLHGTPKYTNDGKYYFINGNNLSQRNIAFSDKTKRVNESEFKKHKKELSNRTILISINGTIGNIAFYNDENVVLGKSACYVNLNKNTSKHFVYYVLKSNIFQFYINSFATGTTIKNVSLKTMRSFQFNLPPLPEQKAIAHILGKLDDKIELNRQINQTLETMAQTLFKSWFVDFDPVIDNAIKAGNPIPDPLKPQADKRKNIKSTLPKTTQNLFPNRFAFNNKLKKWIPESWDVKNLGEVLEIKRGKNITKGNFISGAIPVIAGGIKPAGFHNKSNAKQPVITVSSSGANAGFIKLNLVDVWASDCSFISKDFEDNIYYFYHWLSLRQKQIFDMQTGSAQPHIYPKDLNRLQIIIPSENIVKTFESMNETYYKRNSLMNNATQTLIKLRDTLLPKLISGKIRVSNNLNMEK